MTDRLSERPESFGESPLLSVAGMTRVLMVCLSIPAIGAGALLAAVFMPCAYVLGYRMRPLPRSPGRPPRGGSRVSVATAMGSHRVSRLLG